MAIEGDRGFGGVMSQPPNHDRVLVLKGPDAQHRHHMHGDIITGWGVKTGTMMMMMVVVRKRMISKTTTATATIARDQGQHVTYAERLVLAIDFKTTWSPYSM